MVEVAHWYQRCVVLRRMVSGAGLQIVPGSSVSGDLDVLPGDLAMRGDGALPGAQLPGDLEAYLVLGVPLHLIWSKFTGIAGPSSTHWFELHRMYFDKNWTHFVGCVCLWRQLFPPIMVHSRERTPLQRHLYAAECRDHSDIIYALPA